MKSISTFSSVFLYTAFVAVFSYLLIFPMLEDFLVTHHMQSPTGEILVDAPEIQTRERLVNDRFQQDAWLNSQLREVERVFNETRVQGIERNLRTQRGWLGVGAGQLPAENASGASDAEAPASHASTRPNASTLNLKLAPRFVDEFKDKLDFRQKIRDEILETQLDDRHDELGNTLIRLKFDASILPEGETPSPIIIMVGLERTDYVTAIDDYSRFIQAGGSHEKARDQPWFLRLIRGAEVYLSWLDALQNKIIASIGELYIARTAQPPIDLFQALQSALVRRAEGDGIFGRELTFDYLYLNYLESFALASSLYSKAPGSKDGDWFAADSILRQPHAFRNLSEVEVPSSCAQTFESFWKEHNLTLDPISAVSQFRDFYATDSTSTPDTRPREIYSNYKKLAPKLNSLRGNEADSISINSQMDKSTALPAIRIPNCPEAKAPALYLHLLAEFLVDRSKQWPSGADLLLDIAASYFVQEAGSALEPYVRLSKKGRCVGNICDVFADVPDSPSPQFSRFKKTLQTSEKPPLPREKIATEILIQEKAFRDTLSRFYDDLTRKAFVYSYAVTPKETTLQISSEKIREISVQLDAELAPSKLNSIEALSASVAKSVLNASSSLRREPVVIGFGDQRPWKRDAKHTREPRPAKADQQSLFGWIIFPDLDNGGRGKYIHVARQVSLSATLSIPAWWRHVDLQVATCWLPRRSTSYGNLANFRDCRNALNVRPDAPELRGRGIGRSAYPIILPNDDESISRAFGFRQPRTPYVKHDPFKANELASLSVGLPGSILVKGGRLWRGSAVTLGSQVADEIVVLPNMQGIVAKFYCIQVPSQYGRGFGNSMSEYQVPVTVWTSEGQGEAGAGLALVTDRRSTAAMALPACSDDGRPRPVRFSPTIPPSAPTTGFGPS